MKATSIARLSFPLAAAIIGLAAVALPLVSQAAPVIWGAWTAVTDNTAIQTLGGYTTYGGVNFNGSTTTINNGSTDVTFTGIAQNASGAAAGITVGTSGFAFQSTGNNSNVVSAVGSPQTWTTVLDRVIGDYGAVDATIDLTDLTSGDNYYVQFFSSAPDANILDNSKIASGGVDSPFFGNHAGGGTKYIIATFTADGTSQSFSISGSEPTYSVLVIGVQPATGPDITAPEWIATWPKADPLSTTSLTVRAKTNETGTAYYVVLPDGATAPSAAQVKAGTDSSNASVSASGSLALTVNTEAATPVGSLSPNTAYDVWFVAEDGVPNLQAAPTMVDASTPDPDTTAPDWIATWPKAEQLSPTSLTVRAKTDETGTAYYVVLATGATAPTAAQVKAGNDSTDAPALKSGSIPVTANTEATAPVDALTTDSTYDVYFVAEDAVPNLQAAPSMISVSLMSTGMVTWEPSWTAVTDNTAIQTLGGYTTYGGVNFNGSTTTISNGSTDVTFTGIAQNASGSVAGITVGTSGFNFQSTGNNSNVVAAVGSPQTWTTVLDRVIGDFDNSATIDLTGLTVGSSYYVQFFSSAPDANILNNSKIAGGGIESPTFGLHASGGTKYIIATFTADNTSLSFSITGTEPTYSALVIGVQPAGGGNTFADWIGTFSGLNGLTGFNDDADADGLDNGLENFLGTAPNAGNAGLTAGRLSGDTFTFTHPQNATPASDVSAPAYTWSTDLQTFHASGASAGGITVNLVATPDTPSAGTTTVTATVTGTTPSKLLVRLGVTQQ
jgi:hypothetical protein